MSVPVRAAEKSKAGQKEEDLSEKVTFEARLRQGRGEEGGSWWLPGSKLAREVPSMAATGRPCDLWSRQRLHEGFDSE